MGCSGGWGGGGTWRASQHTRANPKERCMTIFVGNMPWAMIEEDLHQLFNRYGLVASVRIATDRTTGRSRGFGFVEMPNAAEAEAAIAGLNGTPWEGRPLTVNESRPREGDTRSRRPRW